jgi:UPF0716 protein FxsA
MPILLFLCFLAVPIAEIAVFVEAGRLIGVIPTILLTIATAMLGTFLMRAQGIATLNRISQSIEKGETPVASVMDGMGIFVAGILLLTPGFLSDLLGLLLFVPPIRRSLGKWIFRKLARSGGVHFSSYGASSSTDASARPQDPPRARPSTGSFKRADDVVDAEFETIKPEETDPKAPPAEPLNGKSPGTGRSPWGRR